MTNKIMNGDRLDNTLGRLICCAAVFNVLHADMAGGDICVDALAGAVDLLETITRDFEADMKAAADYDRGATT